MKPPRPKMTLSESREIKPVEAQVIDAIIRKYALSMFRKSPLLQRLGLEKTLEETEEFFDEGVLTIIHEPELKTFVVGVWNFNTEEYDV